MGLRSRLGNGLVRVGKTFGGSVPAAMLAGEEASQMTPASPFSPGTPVGPYDGFDRHPRAHDFTTGYNIATRPRTHEAVSFSTLQGLIQSYDIADICIWHRIDSIRSLDWKLLPAEHYNGDVTDAIPLGLAALRKPDRINSFKTWLAKYLYDVLAYDAGTLYRLRNRAGRAVGLSVVDGTSVAPLLDYWGNPPQPPAEAFVQYVNGLPWNWLTRDDIIYEPFRPRPNSPYGHAPIESIMLNANTDLRFQTYFLQRFCYDENTEILTRDGWKRLPDVQGDEEFATRSASGEFEWQASKDGKLHVFDSGGTMVEFRNRYVDLLVTPNHRMLVRRKSQGEGLQKKGRDWEWDWHVRRADEFLGRCTVDWRLPLTSTWTAPEGVPTRFTRALDAAGGRTGRGSTTAVDMPMWAFARFLGLYIAEGWLRHTPPGQHDRWEISVAQMAGGKLDEVRRILKDTGLNWTYHSSERSGKFTVGCKALWTYLEQCGRGAWNKVLPDEVMDWPAGLLEDLIYGLMTGDGTVNASGLRTYLTTSPRLADQVQEIWQKCGTYSSIAAKEPPASTFGKRTIYRVQSRREAEFQMPKPAEVPYDGNVYCVSVPNGIVLVRRNGKTMWCGNTDGNLPAAFAASPDTWSPDQIEQFQAYWDAMMYGDQSRKHQIRWMPPGSKFEWSNEKDFSDTFSLFLMRKTCASFHVVPSDIGFTENVNRSSGESQADVQHRVGDLPLMEHFEGILSQFLQDDLGLPLRHEFDRGEEQVDQAAQAEADQRYMDRAVVSASEIREMRYGLTDTTPVARVFFTERAGPIPLNSLEAVAGPVDAQTAAPEQGAVLPRTAFLEAPGVQPNPPLYGQPLAEEIYGPTAIPPKTETASTLPVGKEAAEGGATAGITSETGLTSYDLIRGDGEPDEAEVAKEMAAFRRFERARRRSGEWRDFEFRAVEAVCGHNLNDAGRLSVRKAAGEVAVAGLAVLAADTGRVLMLQRALCDDDPAAGMWEFPGGHIEQGETPLAGAWREWAEETGCVPPPGVQAGSWISPDGVYQGIAWTVDTEASVPVRCDTAIANPDDPDGDQAEAIAWWNPADLPGNPAIRPELAADLDAVMAALGCPAEGDESVCPCGVPVVYDEMNGWQHADGSISHDDGESVSDKMESVAKASGSTAAPKFRPPTLDIPNLTGAWAEVYDRREKLLRKHLKAVAAAWDACMAELGSPLPVVRQLRGMVVPVAKLADPDRKRWQDAGTAAALAWLRHLAKTKGWPALVAALEDAIRSGMAEGEADALALAADRQGKAGFQIGRAFRAAYERLAGDAKVARQAQDAAAGIVDGAAGDAGRVLADQAGGDGSEQDMADAVGGALAGDRSQSVGLGVDWQLWAGISAGALALYRRIGTGGTGGNAADVASLAWVTAGDSRVCPVPCQENEDNSPYTISNAPTMPGHPRCRCSWDTTATVASSWLDDFLS